MVYSSLKSYKFSKVSVCSESVGIKLLNDKRKNSKGIKGESQLKSNAFENRLYSGIDPERVNGFLLEHKTVSLEVKGQLLYKNKGILQLHTSNSMAGAATPKSYLSEERSCQRARKGNESSLHRGGQ